MEVISLDVAKLQGNTATVTKQVENTAIKADTEGNGGQSSAREVNSYYRYDTMELSQNYLEYKTKSENSAVQSDTNQLNALPAQEKPSAVPPQPADDEALALENEVRTLLNLASYDGESESVSNDETLSSFTNSELKGMLQEGKITVAEYNTEIESREEDNQTGGTQEQDNNVKQPQMQNTKTQNAQNPGMVANPSII
ncbi:hypothetical protein GH808_12890 [Acetobacterium fimetarium]|uniref:Uncharacterized protein n=1 Tax=Acetobacterium fimetarium TaxID=52691 RepID=A0ABR6WXX0_9FIRM|nr:hypothetical protein [Acetobacterium fimetarium]MBC3805313.1 hypothetical protein [Acetobacterium fimetarium]